VSAVGRLQSPNRRLSASPLKKSVGLIDLLVVFIIEDSDFNIVTDLN
jgi:hypothetical protein